MVIVLEAGFYRECTAAVNSPGNAAAALHERLEAGLWKREVLKIYIVIEIVGIINT